MKKILIVVLIVIGVGILIPSVKTSNCGGNSAALSYTRSIAVACNLMLFDKKNGNHLKIEELFSNDEMNGVISFGWGVKSYWLKNEIEIDEESPIAICGQNFSNVPRPTIWNLYRTNPGFAVAYIDGTARVMSIEEFSDFDFTEYTYIREKD
ncbi:MAG: hypothetical protein ACSHYA_19030 [Opitutaceae bacterium]